jgi:hypothetical protein
MSFLLLGTQNTGVPMGNPTHTHILGMGWVWYGLEKMGNFGLGTKESKVLGSISKLVYIWSKIHELCDRSHDLSQAEK